MDVCHTQKISRHRTSSRNFSSFFLSLSLSHSHKPSRLRRKFFTRWIDSSDKSSQINQVRLQTIKEKEDLRRSIIVSSGSSTFFLSWRFYQSSSDGTLRSPFDLFLRRYSLLYLLQQSHLCFHPFALDQSQRTAAIQWLSNSQFRFGSTSFHVERRFNQFNAKVDHHEQFSIDRFLLEHRWLFIANLMGFVLFVKHHRQSPVFNQRHIVDKSVPTARHQRAIGRCGRHFHDALLVALLFHHRDGFEQFSFLLNSTVRQLHVRSFVHLRTYDQRKQFLRIIGHIAEKPRSVCREICSFFSSCFFLLLVYFIICSYADEISLYGTISSSYSTLTATMGSVLFIVVRWSEHFLAYYSSAFSPDLSAFPSASFPILHLLPMDSALSSSLPVIISNYDQSLSSANTNRTFSDDVRAGDH